MQAWKELTARTCKVQTMTVGGVAYPVPDPNCTPGAVNPTLTLSILKRKTFRTGCERDKASSANAKINTYAWYGIAHPVNSTHTNQVCELDHLISIEIGG